jgi:hypothetical protein
MPDMLPLALVSLGREGELAQATAAHPRIAGIHLRIENLRFVRKPKRFNAPAR